MSIYSFKVENQSLKFQHLYSSFEGISVFFTSMIAYETLGVTKDLSFLLTSLTFYINIL